MWYDCAAGGTSTSLRNPVASVVSVTLTAGLTVPFVTVTVAPGTLTPLALMTWTKSAPLVLAVSSARGAARPVKVNDSPASHVVHETETSTSL